MLLDVAITALGAAKPDGHYTQNNENQQTDEHGAMFCPFITN
jgi:hypothetical protein